ncbi:leucine-rich repeat and IQ domain-containing protein 3 isoform X3 [Meriones unguiculatus]|uniref:leucine-rich repeat and IQ domain-containing protein 3 isoform X3 n=1 Tax=Meriones unguiculatus TaxID=10047 RepID=UPI00293F1A4F|nr:leucine-rich repeat and IQ domain-containing protein 3 isoform X3 [Meriones unguiculatus]
MFHGTITKELTSHEEWSHYNENIVEDQKDFVFMKYNGLHLKSMESVQSCISLRVCIFSNNFITDIYPLQSCIKLIKLDLHGNQIKTLPDKKFWSGLKNLKLLFLHDNGLSKLKNICVLAACSTLTGLTMFDCPVSLKNGYRHVLVNSIWTLKTLDHHVISDEEIIQNWHLPERFKRFNDRLYLDICSSLKKMVSTPDNFKHSTEYRNIPWFAYELKMKDTDGKPKTRRHHIQKGPKETKDESDEEEVDTRFRISAMKIPLYSPRTFTYGAMLKEMKRDYIPDYVQPLPAPRPKPPIKTETLKELRKRKEFLTSERAGMNLHMFNDIDKYHVEQKHQEREERKLKAVITAQVSQERARLSIKEHGRRKIHMAQKQVEKDHETIQKGLRKIWKEKLAYLGKVRERKSMFLAEKKLKATEHSLVQSMNNERSVLLRGINNVDRLKRNLSDSRNKHRIVAEKWKAEKYKNSLLRQGKELRAEETRRKHREEKFVIDTLILHKACERFEEAKAKVALIKSLERHRE